MPKDKVAQIIDNLTDEEMQALFALMLLRMELADVVRILSDELDQSSLDELYAQLS